MGTIAGKLIRIKVGDVEIDCQTNATLTSTADVVTQDPCKGDSLAASNSYGTTSWTISAEGKTLLETAGTNQSTLLAAQLAGTKVEVEMLTLAGEHDNDEDIIWSGLAVITNVTIEAPVQGDSTWTAEFTGDGALTQTRVPVVAG